MNVLFLTIGDIPSIQHHEIYPDLLREFLINGHKVFVVCCREKRVGLPTELIEEDGASLLKVKIGNITKTNKIEKGISTILLEYQYKFAIVKYFSNVKFDMIMYSTPPITIANIVEFLKRRDGAKTYLLLKDIFPQNAVDLGMMSKKGILYRHFRGTEKRLYKLSDKIGCMSQANVDYIIKHNPEIDSSNVEVCPNSIEIIDKSVDPIMRNTIRAKYGIPINKMVLIYGGNLGKPQGIPFFIECIKKCSGINNAFFLIVGDGTEFELINSFIKHDNPANVRLLKRLPKEEYDMMVGACDAGIVFLDHRFTIPNIPSRMLAYMEAKIPVVACTDPNSDIGKIIENGNFGWWCESNDSSKFAAMVQNIENCKAKGEAAFTYLTAHYSVKDAYNTIMSENGVF